VAQPESPAYSLTTRQDGGRLVLAPAGRLDAEAMSGLMAQARAAMADAPTGEVELDLAGVKYLDGAGALAVNMVKREAQKAGREVGLSNLPPGADGLMKLADPKYLDVPPLITAARRRGLVTQVGEMAAMVAGDLARMVEFLGGFFAAVLQVIKRPQLIRLGDAAYYMERVGVDGLGIVGLVSLLLGLIIAFMSSLQLASFGANIYVADLVGVAMTRELGPIMTAILVAGRSGSSFAAEIGTMRVNEEVDALTVMGYDPITFLALPKVLAAVIVIPLLTLYSDCLGIIGGMLVGVLGLDLTLFSYVKQTAGALSIFDIVSGMLKAVVFALIIAGVGCQRGFMVRGGAQAVGSATTSAVVTAMFLIIVTDSVFAIVLHYVE